MALQAASWHSSLTLRQIPDDDIGILLLLSLTHTGGDISPVTRSYCKHFKNMTVELLLLGPERTRH